MNKWLSVTNKSLRGDADVSNSRLLLQFKHSIKLNQCDCSFIFNKSWMKQRTKNSNKNMQRDWINEHICYTILMPGKRAQNSSIVMIISQHYNNH